MEITTAMKFRSWTGTKYIYWGFIDGQFISPPYRDDKIITDVDQWSGRKDKNGSDIYATDIIQIPEDWDEYGHNCGEVYEIYFAYGGFRLKPKYESRAKGFWLEDDGEVIKLGDARQNPELIPKK